MFYPHYQQNNVQDSFCNGPMSPQMLVPELQDTSTPVELQVSGDARELPVDFDSNNIQYIESANSSHCPSPYHTLDDHVLHRDTPSYRVQSNPTPAHRISNRPLNDAEQPHVAPYSNYQYTSTLESPDISPVQEAQHSFTSQHLQLVPTMPEEAHTQANTSCSSMSRSSSLTLSPMSPGSGESSYRQGQQYQMQSNNTHLVAALGTTTSCPSEIPPPVTYFSLDGINDNSFNHQHPSLIFPRRGSYPTGFRGPSPDLQPVPDFASPAPESPVSPLSGFESAELHWHSRQTWTQLSQSMNGAAVETIVNGQATDEPPPPFLPARNSTHIGSASPWHAAAAQFAQGQPAAELEAPHQTVKPGKKRKRRASIGCVALFTPLPCDLCDEVFHGLYQKGNQRRHMKQKHSAEPTVYRCRQCGDSYNRDDARRKHEWKKHRSPDCQPDKRRQEKTEKRQKKKAEKAEKRIYMPGVLERNVSAPF